MSDCYLVRLEFDLKCSGPDVEKANVKIQNIWPISGSKIKSGFIAEDNKCMFEEEADVCDLDEFTDNLKTFVTSEFDIKFGHIQIHPESPKGDADYSERSRFVEF